MCKTGKKIFSDDVQTNLCWIKGLCVIWLDMQILKIYFDTFIYIFLIRCAYGILRSLCSPTNFFIFLSGLPSRWNRLANNLENSLKFAYTSLMKVPSRICLMPNVCCLPHTWVVWTQETNSMELITRDKSDWVQEYLHKKSRQYVWKMKKRKQL